MGRPFSEITAKGKLEKDSERPQVLSSIDDIQRILLGIYESSAKQIESQDPNEQKGQVSIDNGSPRKPVQTTKDYDFETYFAASVILQNLDFMYTDLIDN